MSIKFTSFDVWVPNLGKFVNNELIDWDNTRNLEGFRFNKLTVLGRPKIKNGKWECRCECSTLIDVAKYELRKGAIKSCGCANRALLDGRHAEFKKRFPNRKRITNIFADMKRRCCNPDCANWPNYGQRGITVCREWDNLDNFYNWSISNGYKPNLELDRIDVNGNYEPSNCRYVINELQANNKRNSHYLEYNGEKLTVSQWAKRLKIRRSLLDNRLQDGWSVEKALFEPISKRHSHKYYKK